MSNFLPANAAVWFEIPAKDFEKTKAFYAAVLQTEMTTNDDGPNPMAPFATKEPGAVAGHVYPGKPAARGTGNTIHLAVASPLEDAMQRVADNGGEVVSPIVTIPAGRFVYCLDPDGNSIGLFA